MPNITFTTYLKDEEYLIYLKNKPQFRKSIKHLVRNLLDEQKTTEPET